jgi:hypothetical protein
MVLAAGSFAFARTIQGTVTNKTNGKLAAGDKVTLLSLTAGLEEVTSTTTDAQGHFTLKTPAEDPYLIKVEHQKGAYFKNVPPGVTTAEIVVYDVAAKVEGVSTYADVLRVETDNGQLKVTEYYLVNNASSPPRTESSEHTFEVVLPPEAVLEAAATVGPNSLPLAATPDPISPKGHYAFSYPIRPNEGDNGTRFQLTYHLPYSGSYKFTPKLILGADNVAVMLPKSMKFDPSAGSNFQPGPSDGNGQAFVARDVKAGQPVEFTVSGTGALPRDAEAGGPSTGGGSPGAGADDSAAANGPGGKPGGGLGNPIDTPDPLSKYKYWILGGLAIVLAGAAAFLLRKPAGAPVLPAGSVATAVSVGPQTAAFTAPNAATKSQLLLEALKEELFAIESEKIAGTLSAAEYAEVKTALEIVLRRALGRQ